MNTIPLRIAAEREEGDALLELEGDQVPWLRGTEDESLACGSCGYVVADGVSVQTAFLGHRVRKRMLIRCFCGSLNIFPSMLGGPEGAASPHSGYTRPGMTGWIEIGAKH